MPYPLGDKETLPHSIHSIHVVGRSTTVSEDNLDLFLLIDKIEYMAKDRKQLIDYWLKAAQKDLKVMKSLFEKKHYPYSLYFGHLVLEKTLKGYYVKAINKSTPYTHNLKYLAEKCKLTLNNSQKELLEAVTRFNIEARYPDVSFKFHKLCTRKFTKKYILEIKEFYKWLSKLIQ